MRKEFKDLFEQLSFGYNLDDPKDAENFKQVFINTYGGTEELFDSFINDDEDADNKIRSVVKMNIFNNGGHLGAINKSAMQQVIAEKERIDFLKNYGKTVAQVILRDAALIGA